MLKAFRDTPRHVSPEKTQDAEFASVDAWRYTDSSGQVKHHFVSRRLEQAQVEDWACRRGVFSGTGIPGNHKADGGLRLLFVQPHAYFHAAVPTQIISATVQEALKLPECTFASFQQPPGVFSFHTYPEQARGDDYTRLSLVMRTPQRWECSIGGVAVSHDFETGTTTALNLGYAFLLDQYKEHDKPPQLLLNFYDSIQDCKSYWAHPLLLPCLFLATNVQRVRTYLIDHINREVVHIEQSIGVTIAGRSQRFYDNDTESQKLFIKGQMQRHHAQALIASINDISTWIVFTKRSPQWAMDYIDALLALLQRTPRLHHYRGATDTIFRETLAYMHNYSDASRNVAQTSEARMALQLNILYTSIAQDDGQTSARIAAAAGRDSTSMKILALVSAAYLPGTFVATLFAMGMFSWSGGADSSSSSSSSRAGSAGEEKALSSPETQRSSSVSPDFWVYFAVAVPLTVVTLAGWAVWWRFEQYRFDRDVRCAVVQQGPLSGKRRGWEEGKMPCKKKFSA